MSTHAPRSISRVTSRVVLALSLAPSLACSDLGGHELLVEGNDAVNAGIPDTATDGWAISFSSFVVVVHDPGLIERRDDAPTWVREYGVTVWDLRSADDPMGVLDRQIRATEYDGVDFRVAPASASASEAVAGNVDSDAVSAAVDDDWSIHVVGAATGPMGEMVSFDWAFTTNTRYRCNLDDDARVAVPAEGAEVSVIEILGDALFRSEVGNADAALAFQPIADADGDGDGSVTLAELDAAGLLGDMEALTRELGSVRGAGACDSFEGGVEPDAG